MSLLGAIGIDSGDLLAGLSAKWDSEAAIATTQNNALLASLIQQNETQQMATPSTVAGQSNQETDYRQLAIFGGLGLAGLVGVVLLVKAL